MAKQKQGQNFLHDKNIAARIAGLISGGDKLIVEIGPGKGVMTEILVESGQKKIIAVEIDNTLYDNLIRREFEGVSILNKDILEMDPAGISHGEKIHLLGNIPYYISKEIIDWIITGYNVIEKGALMVQKEFFQKITASPGTKKYNAQTVMFTALFDTKKSFEVGQGAFSPPPKVTSTVFTFSKRGQVPITGDLMWFYRFLKTAFSHRRKTLINNLAREYNTNRILNFLESESLSHAIRAEDISPENFQKLFNNLKP